MQAELARMSEENLRLRGVLGQVTNNYNALQLHLITLMQQRGQRNGSNDVRIIGFFLTIFSWSKQMQFSWLDQWTDESMMI